MKQENSFSKLLPQKTPVAPPLKPYKGASTSIWIKLFRIVYLLHIIFFGMVTVALIFLKNNAPAETVVVSLIATFICVLFLGLYRKINLYKKYILSLIPSFLFIWLVVPEMSSNDNKEYFSLISLGMFFFGIKTLIFHPRSSPIDAKKVTSSTFEIAPDKEVKPIKKEPKQDNDKPVKSRPSITKKFIIPSPSSFYHRTTQLIECFVSAVFSVLDTTKSSLKKHSPSLTSITSPIFSYASNSYQTHKEKKQIKENYEHAVMEYQRLYAKSIKEGTEPPAAPAMHEYRAEKKRSPVERFYWWARLALLFIPGYIVTSAVFEVGELLVNEVKTARIELMTGIEGQTQELSALKQNLSTMEKQKLANVEAATVEGLRKANQERCNEMSNFGRLIAEQMGQC